MQCLEEHHLSKMCLIISRNLTPLPILASSERYQTTFDITEDGGLNEVALVSNSAASSDQIGAFVPPFLDEPQYLVKLLLRNLHSPFHYLSAQIFLSCMYLLTE